MGNRGRKSNRQRELEVKERAKELHWKWLKKHSENFKAVAPPRKLFPPEEHFGAEVLQELLDGGKTGTLSVLILANVVKRIDFERMDVRELWELAVDGAAYEVVFRLCGEHRPGEVSLLEELPGAFIDFWRGRGLFPFVHFLTAIIAGRLCRLEIERRAEKQPVAKWVQGYIIGKDVDAQRELDIRGVIDEKTLAEIANNSTQQVLKIMEPYTRPLVKRFPKGIISESRDESQRPVTEAEVTAQEGILEGLEYWREKGLQEAVFAGLEGRLPFSLRLAAKRNLLDEIEDKVVVEIDGEEYEVSRVSPISSLIGEGAAEDDTGITLLELLDERLSEGGFEEADRKLTLDAAIENAKLPKREQMVVDLRRKGKSDREIALALKEAFGKRVSESNVRKLWHDALQRLKGIMPTTE